MSLYSARTYKSDGLFRITKQSTARYFCNRSRYREVSWVGLIMFSKQTITEKKVAIVPPLLCMNQYYISALKSERLPLFWYALIIFTVCI
jgi:hypothetical protein